MHAKPDASQSSSWAARRIFCVAAEQSWMMKLSNPPGLYRRNNDRPGGYFKHFPGWAHSCELIEDIAVAHDDKMPGCLFLADGHAWPLSTS